MFIHIFTYPRLPLPESILLGWAYRRDLQADFWQTVTDLPHLIHPENSHKTLTKGLRMILLLESAIVGFIEAKLPDNIPSSGLHSTENEKEHHGAHSAVHGPKWPKMAQNGPNMPKSKQESFAVSFGYPTPGHFYWKNLKDRKKGGLGGIETLNFQPPIISNTSWHQKTPHQHPPRSSWTKCNTHTHTLPISRFGSLQAPTGLDTDDEVRIVLNDFEDHDQQHLMQRYADTPAESWESWHVFWHVFWHVRTEPPGRGSKCIRHSWRWTHQDWSVLC